MAKVTSLNGKVTGKVGGVVYSTVAGQTIAREYNPVVANPNTSRQVDARAKFKLMSQLAAALAPVIAIPREGLVSPRNQFMKRNKDIAFASGGVAQVTYENLQLTKSSIGLPGVLLTRGADGNLTINLAEAASARVARVVYILYKKNTERQLEYVRSIVQSTTDSARDFVVNTNDIDGELVCFAYGILDKNAGATANYANYNVNSAEDIATLVYNRTMSTADYSLTQTRGSSLAADATQSTQPAGEGQARVYVTATGGGTATGAGVFNIGSQVTVTATPDASHRFAGWRIQGQVNYVSTDASYTFTLQMQTDLVAVFTSIDSGDGWDQN